MSSEQRGRRFVFTINNPTDEEIRNIKNGFCEDGKYTDPQNLAINCIEILIAEMEEGEQEHTQHIQGYITFSDRIYRRVVEAILGGRAYIEIAKGSTADNIIYCTKDSKKDKSKLIQYYFKSSPERTRWENMITLKTKKTGDEQAKEILDDIEKLSEKDFEETHPSYYLHSYAKYKEIQHIKKQKCLETYNGDLQKKNFWIWGPTGTGKSRFARGNLECVQIFDKPINKWWNGYDGQRRVIMDDFPAGDAGNCLVQHMKRWSDRYPFTGEIKGAHSAISPNDFELVVTSNYRINECFKEPEDIRALQRRFKEIPFGEGDDKKYKSIEHLKEDVEEEDFE